MLYSFAGLYLFAKLIKSSSVLTSTFDKSSTTFLFLLAGAVEAGTSVGFSNLLSLVSSFELS